MSTFCTFLLFLCFTGLAAQRNLDLMRVVEYPDDTFNLPRDTPECPWAGIGMRYVPSCSKYNARVRLGIDWWYQDCWCYCHRPYSQRKYTFFEPSFSCVEVSVARQKSGKCVSASLRGSMWAPVFKNWNLNDRNGSGCRSYETNAVHSDRSFYFLVIIMLCIDYKLYPLYLVYRRLWEKQPTRAWEK